jgi:hypothetical protein
MQKQKRGEKIESSRPFDVKSSLQQPINHPAFPAAWLVSQAWSVWRSSRLWLVPA